MLLAKRDDRLASEKRVELAEQYGSQAVQYLGQAIAQGYRLKAETLQKSPLFAPIRERADFQTLLKELQKQAPAEKK